ncbi:MAG: DUF1700 domain-containing protein [Prevotella sp.]|nr:DUF1700 domain-containing protein [Staphylococcus sp.]MCM1350657.1 DUF1700 domain-containing protein [Prevotella sp.]
MRTQAEFLGELEEELRYLNAKDASQVLKYYRDKINIALDYGESLQKVMATLPEPKKIAEEIYASKGIEYVNKRKKELKRKQIISSIISILILLLVVSAFFVISYFIIRYIIQLGTLIGKSFSFFSFIDTALLVLFCLCYMGILIGIYIYVFDLFYIMTMHFLQDVLWLFGKKEKEYAFMDFTISSFLDTATHKNKLVLKIMGIIALVWLGLGITSYATKGYIYRSFHDEASNTQKIEIEEDVKQIVMPSNASFIQIVESDVLQHIQIEYTAEFAKDVKYEMTEGTLKIAPLYVDTFDVLGLLDEPRPVIKISIPKTMTIESLDIALNDGILDIVDYHQKGSLTISGTKGTIAITRSTFDTCTIDGYGLISAFEENNITNLDIKLESGKYYAVKDIYQNIQIQNHLGTLVLEDVQFEDGKINNESAKSAFNRIKASILTFSSRVSEDYFQDSYFQNLVLTGNGNTKINLDRIIVEETVQGNFQADTIQINCLKTKLYQLSTEHTTIYMHQFGQNTTATSEDEKVQQKIDAYNAFVAPCTVEATLKSGKVEILSSFMDTFHSTVQKTTIEMTQNTILETTTKTTNGKWIINDLDGKTIQMDVDGGSIMFFNDHIQSDITLEITGQLVKTALAIGENIKQVNTDES